MPAVKPTVTGYGMNLMYVPSFRKPIAARINPDIIVASSKPVDAVRLRRRGDEHDECAGRPADLKAAATERRDDETADDCGIQPLRRR